jgi:hypothetical protein
MFGIAWGVGSLLLLIGLGEGFRSGQRKNMANMGEDVIFLFAGRIPALPGQGLGMRPYFLTYQDFLDVKQETTLVRNLAPVIQRGDPLARPYIGTLLSEIAGTEASYKIVFPRVNLPANFRRMGGIMEPASGQPLHQAEAKAGWWYQAYQQQTAWPRVWAIEQARNDVNQVQILLYPAPDIVRSYEIFYCRDPGWFDNVDPHLAAWKVEATVDTDYLDWPDRQMDLFYRAALLSLYEESDPEGKLGTAMGAFHQSLQQCKADDNRYPSIDSMTRQHNRGYGLDIRLPEIPVA